MSSRSTTRRSDAPQPLSGQMLAFEQARHAARLATIKRMGARLALLDAFMPALAVAGIVLNLDDINDWGGKTIYLGSGIMDHARNARLANVLVAGGMRIDVRREHDHGAKDVWLELVKGRLRVAIGIDGRSKHLLEVPTCA